MEKWNFEWFCLFCLQEDVNISLEKVQFEMICQGIIYLRNKIFLKSSYIRSSVYTMVIYYVSFKSYKPFVFFCNYDEVVLLHNR